MSKINGSYVEQLEIDFELDEKHGKARNLEAGSEKFRNGEINDNCTLMLGVPRTMGGG